VELPGTAPGSGQSLNIFNCYLYYTIKVYKSTCFYA